MAIEKHDFPRYGGTIKGTWGVDMVTGKSQIYSEMADPHPLTKQIIRRFPDEMVIKFDSTKWEGNITGVTIQFKEGFVTVEGVPLSGTEKTTGILDGRSLKASTKDADLRNFVRALHNIAQSIFSLDMRETRGHENTKPFDDFGNIIEYPELVPPNFAYHAVTPPEPPTPTE